jgi:glycerol-3-phosphate dehydrogenase (NAD(P)+)
MPIVSATKGIENDTLLTMDEVLEDVLPPEMHPYLAFLSGPSFAKETAQKMPTAVVIAGTWERIAKQVQKAFSNDFFRCYTSNDVAGVELGGSLKNVCAIAAGIADGMGFGHNTRAAIITRGLAELVRLATRKGANPITLSGLAGMGDLVLTCTGDLSRNRSVGLRLGRGEKLADVLASMTQVAEGVRTAKSVHDLAAKLSCEMPLHEAVYRILYEDLAPRAAMAQLTSRELKSEFSMH